MKKLLEQLKVHKKQAVILGGALAGTLCVVLILVLAILPTMPNMDLGDGWNQSTFTAKASTATNSKTDKTSNKDSDKTSAPSNTTSDAASNNSQTNKSDQTSSSSDASSSASTSKKRKWRIYQHKHTNFKEYQFLIKPKQFLK